MEQVNRNEYVGKQSLLPEQEESIRQENRAREALRIRLNTFRQSGPVARPARPGNRNVGTPLGISTPATRAEDELNRIITSAIGAVGASRVFQAEKQVAAEFVSYSFDLYIASTPADLIEEEVDHQDSNQQKYRLKLDVYLSQNPETGKINIIVQNVILPSVETIRLMRLYQALIQNAFPGKGLKDVETLSYEIIVHRETSDLLDSFEEMDEDEEERLMTEDQKASFVETRGFGKALHYHLLETGQNLRDVSISYSNRTSSFIAIGF